MVATTDALAEMEEPPAVKKRRKREKRQEKDPTTKLTRRQQFFFIGSAVLLVLSAVIAILGWRNSKHFYLVCSQSTITAQQGSFWPYGRDQLPGDAFDAIEGTHPCTSQHYEKRADLEEAFLAALIEQATRLLKNGDAEHVASAEKQLQQALLLSRNPERGEAREMAERLQGDVSYWRGAAEIAKVLQTLGTSASFFEEAATKRPRHSNDANAWAEHARFIGSEIDKGPRELRKDESPQEEPHFRGLSDPTEDEGGDQDPAGDDDEPEGDDDEPEDPEEADAAPAVTPIDAGTPDSATPIPDAALPTGGVLL